MVVVLLMDTVIYNHANNYEMLKSLDQAIVTFLLMLVEISFFNTERVQRNPFLLF